MTGGVEYSLFNGLVVVVVVNVLFQIKKEREIHLFGYINNYALLGFTRIQQCCRRQRRGRSRGEAEDEAEGSSCCPRVPGPLVC